jgi:hypothetical protein
MKRILSILALCSLLATPAYANRDIPDLIERLTQKLSDDPHVHGVTIIVENGRGIFVVHIDEGIGRKQLRRIPNKYHGIPVIIDYTDRYTPELK